MRRTILFIILAIFLFQANFAENRIYVKCPEGTANNSLADALMQAASFQGKPVTIQLEPGVYSFKRSLSTQKVFHVSNTTSESENPECIKHIAVWMNGLKNVTIDGAGATWLMTGEMTTFIAQACQNITLKNLNIDYQFPTQTEMTVLEDGKDYIITQVHPTSQYQIIDGKLTWYGDGWSFNKGIAQWYDPLKDITWREWSPMSGLSKTIELRHNLLYMQYTKKKPQVPIGTVFQMRDGLRDEVCGCFDHCKNIRLENVNFWYLGNFGIVVQYTDGFSVERCRFMPKPGSGRTNAGFADFIQISGCKGTVSIYNSEFAGAHDDPINIHGTHLKVVSYLNDRTIRVRFMHGQTFGLQAFHPKDEIELINAQTLQSLQSAQVVKVNMINEREFELTLNRPITSKIKELKDIAVENITWTPEVHIAGNTFRRSPTRGILVTTRRPVVIENNLFYGMQMSAILVADEAMSWYESGPVHNLIIRRNTFLQCNSPMILIYPEYHQYLTPVHKNIRIEENIFESDNPSVKAIQARGVDGLTIQNNHFKMAGKDLIQIEECEHIIVNEDSYK